MRDTDIFVFVHAVATYTEALITLTLASCSCVKAMRGRIGLLWYVELFSDFPF